jgi:hypothetical protein
VASDILGKTWTGRSTIVSPIDLLSARQALGRFLLGDEMKI